MLTSLEVRAPLLDPKIIEFAFTRVPDRLRANGKRRKILLQLLGRRLLPADFDLARKQGFSLPETWFRGQWRKYIQEVLSQAEARLFDQDEIQKLIRGQRKGRSNSERLFALTIFELWRREYKVALPA